ncbi:hypothetical protein I317_03170 [Kwoniella heveanensis CBS 569]|nr:hypothetical protein I317_03170 [Kwoniella heveanensis CBS 569]
MQLRKQPMTVFTQLLLASTRSRAPSNRIRPPSALYHSFVKVESPPAPLPSSFQPYTTAGVITYTQPSSPQKFNFYDPYSPDPSDHIIDLTPGTDYSDKPDVMEYLRSMGQRRGYVGKQWYSENVERGRAYLEEEMKQGRGFFVRQLPEGFFSSPKVTRRRRQAWVHLAQLEEIEDAALDKSTENPDYWLEAQRKYLAAGKGWDYCSGLSQWDSVAYDDDDLYPARTGLLKTNIRAPIPSDLKHIQPTDDEYPRLIRELYRWTVHPVSLAYLESLCPAGYIYCSRNGSLKDESARFKTDDRPEPYVPMDPNDWGADSDGETVHPDAVIGNWMERAEIRRAKADGRWDAWEKERLQGERIRQAQMEQTGEVTLHYATG